MTFRRNPQFIEGVKDTAAKRLAVAGDRVRLQMVRAIETPKSGAVYPGNPRPSSAPGEAPASQSGDLSESLERSQPSVGNNSIDVHVFSWLSRARILQEGTATKAPRPFMMPALFDSMNEINKAMSGEGVSNG